MVNYRNVKYYINVPYLNVDKNNKHIKFKSENDL